MRCRFFSYVVAKLVHSAASVGWLDSFIDLSHSLYDEQGLSLSCYSEFFPSNHNACKSCKIISADGHLWLSQGAGPPLRECKEVIRAETLVDEGSSSEDRR